MDRLNEIEKKLGKPMSVEEFIKFVEEEQEKNWKEDHPGEKELPKES